MSNFPFHALGLFHHLRGDRFSPHEEPGSSEGVVREAADPELMEQEGI